MGTIRTDAGQAPVDVTKELNVAPQKKVVVNASSTTRIDAAGASAGTTEKVAETTAILTD